MFPWGISLGTGRAPDKSIIGIAAETIDDEVR